MTEKGCLLPLQFPGDYVESRPPQPPAAWPPHYDTESAPDADVFASKAAEIRTAVILEIQDEQANHLAQVSRMSHCNGSLANLERVHACNGSSPLYYTADAPPCLMSEPCLSINMFRACRLAVT